MMPLFLAGLTVRTARRAGALLVAAASLVAAGCETTNGSLTSQYLGTQDGRFYQYGNFCGPGWPEYPPNNTAADNIAFIDAIEPVDDLDRACRAHDRCYWQFGADNPQCDEMFAALLRDPGATDYLYAMPNSFLENDYQAQCANLAAEMLTAVAQFKQESFFQQLSDDSDFAAATGLLLGFNALRNISAGFPPVPGLCFFNDQQLSGTGASANSYLQAAAQSAGYSGVSLSSFERFTPADQSSLASGLAALAALTASADEAAAFVASTPAASPGAPSDGSIATNLAATGAQVFDDGGTTRIVYATNTFLDTPTASTVSPRAVPVVERLVNVLSPEQASSIEVSVHTDDQLDLPTSQKVAQQQALVIAQELANRGLVAGGINARGWGSQSPVASNATAEGRAANQRVEIIVTP